jgi:protease IV
MEIQTESIMKSASRSFLKSFSKIFGFSFGIIIVLFLFSTFFNKDLLPPPSIPTILPDAQGERKLLPMNTPALLVIRIDNVIGLGDLTSEKFKDILLDSRSGMFDNNRLKGVLLYINSPGGAAVDSDNIYTAIMQYKKDHKVPVYAFVDGLCASGGMYIASSCDKIFATPTSTIGSVGVRIGPAFNVVQTMEKYGVSSLTFTEGKDKDMLNPFRPWTPDEGASIKNVITAMYERFVDIVTSARPNLSKDALINEYGANIFIASQAEANGYIDESNSSYESAISELAKAANIQEGDAYQVIQLSNSHKLLESFSQTKIESSVRNILGLPSSDLQGKLLLM